MHQARAILWAHTRTAANVFTRGGVAWTAVINAIWHGLWLIAAIAGARLVANPDNLSVVRSALTGTLLLIFLYWQVVPLLMAATGASLELKKLQVYPVRGSHLFFLEVMLRVSSAAEMVMLSLGIMVGALWNAELRAWAAPAVALFILFNLLLSVGLRDLAARLLAYRRIREVAFIALLLLAGLPQLMVFRPLAFQALSGRGGELWNGFPWSAASHLIQARDVSAELGVLALWTLGAGLFGYLMFRSSLSFDAQAASSGHIKPARADGVVERIFRLPSSVWSDPMAVLIEKEVRFLVRSPRFRLVFLMGFTFGLIWLPLSLSRGGLWKTVLGTNYLTAVSVYSLLLLSEVCFWNSFGFDRSAAQFYFLAPIPFERVLIGKNLSAAIFIFLEISLITVVCVFLGLPVKPASLLEAYGVALVLSLLLMSAGNLLSVRQARGVNPATSFRSNAAGRVQAILFLVYPIAGMPAALAYLARWISGSEWAFFAVLAVDAAAAYALYRAALSSATGAAEELKESMIQALSAGDGPIAG